MAHVKHSGGIVDAIIELGFDQVKYFEGSIGLTPVGFTISPPARKLIVNNRSSTGNNLPSNNLFLRVNGSPAATVVGFSPGDNIKISPGGAFSMDFDAIKEISLIADSVGVKVEGILGFKATV